jgi:hypothetical protein
MLSRFSSAAALVLLVMVDAPALPQPDCRPVGDVVRLRELPEGSGVAASRRTPGILWAHNDSGDPVILALTEQGAIAGRVRVTAAAVDDWEDIAVGPCPQGSCVYVGDIGDNAGRRRHVTIYRVPEPSPQDSSTRSAEAFHATYPDGAHDAEALFVTATQEMFIITKGDPGPIALYRFPPPLRAGASVQLERVAAPGPSTLLRAGTTEKDAKVDAADRPTAADVSPDGQWVALRTTHRVVFFRAADLTSGQWRETFRTDVRSLREPRGEGITFGADGTVFLLGEGGGFSRPGTLARLACRLDR